MIFTILGIILGLILYFLAKLYLIPYIKVQNLVKQFEKKGYKVKKFRFTFLGYGLAEQMEKNNFRLQFFKKDYQNYDVAIGNILSNVFIIPIALEIIKDLYSNSKYLQKSQFQRELYQSINGGGIVFSEGESFKRKKKIISTVFHYDFLVSLTPYITETVEAKLKLHSKNIQNGQRIKSRVFIGSILSEVIAKYFFGITMDHIKIKDNTFSEAVLKFTDQFNNYLYSAQHVILGDKGYKYGLSKRARQLKQTYKILKIQVQNLLEKKIQQFKQNSQNDKNLVFSMCKNNLLSRQGSQNQYTFDQMVGQFFVFFIAGTDTTASLLSVILFALSRHPQILIKLREQFNKFPINNFSIQNFKSMTYTDAIINEALRMYGAAAFNFTRQVKPSYIQIGNNVKIPHNYTINFINIINHYNQKYFKDPHVFKPQRWLQQDKNVEPFAFLPFGAGQRNCIGQHLSRLQSKVILSKILQNYDVKSIGQIDMKFGFVYYNINQDVILIPRNKQSNIQK